MKKIFISILLVGGLFINLTYSAPMWATLKIHLWTTFPTNDPSVNSKGIGYLNTWTEKATSTGTGNWLYFVDGWAAKWGESGGQVNSVRTMNYNGADGTVPVTSGYYYTFNFPNNPPAENTSYAILATSASPVTFSSLSQSPTDGIISDNDQITVTVNLNAIKCNEEHVFVCYTIDGWSNYLFTSEATYVGNIATCIIPKQAQGKTVQYYAFSTTVTSGLNAANCNYLTLNYLNNSGANYQYKVDYFGTTTTGDWNTGGTWEAGSAPATNSKVKINHNITINSSVTNATNTLLISSTKSVSFASSGALTVNSALTNQGTIVMTNGGILTLGNGSTFTNGSATFSYGTGKVAFAGAGTVSGTIGFNDVTLAGGVDFGSNSTINGTLTINTGGYVNTNAPTYATGSTLIYNAGTPYDRAAEWSAGSSGQGVPYNVKVNSGVSVNMDRGNGTSDARTVRGKLTLTGSMSFKGSSNSGNGTVGGLTVNGDLLIEGGTLTLGYYINPNGSDLTLFGNWERTSGLFVGNGRAVFLDGTSNTTITTNTVTVINYLYIRKTGSASVTLNNELQVANVATINNGATLNCGTYPITGSGSFTLSSGATLGIGSPDGITTSGATGNIQVTTRTFDAGANYVYNGSAAQVTGNALPATVNNLTIDNAAGVKLSNTALTVSGTMLINSGKLFTLESGKQLTVTGTLTNNATASGLVVKSGGSLIQNSAVSATVERDIPAWTAVPHGWHLLSSPVTSQAISTAFTDATPENYDFYAWWEPTNVWVNFKNTGTTPTWNDANSSSQNFVPGIGYLVSYSSASTKQFTGTLNNSDVTVNNMAISSGTNKGWHLVGNPFSSAVTWSSCTRTNINATAKIWSESDAAYVDVTNGDIPALNGFMVQVTSGTGSLTIPTTARVHNNTTSWYKSGEASEILLVANDPEGQTAQESKIHLDAASTVNFDSEFDSHFLPGYAPQFYSKAGDEMLSTNTLPSLPAETVIPFGFVKNDAASFSIELKQSIAGYSVFLKDLKTNTDQNLSDNPVYTFTSEAGDDPNRFLLHFMDVTSVPGAAKESFSVYMSNGTMNITTGRATNAEIRVSNMAGQVVLQGKTNGNTLTNLSTATLRNGVYVVTLLGSSMVESRKIVLNR